MDEIIKQLRAQGATDADIEAYVRQQGGVEVTPAKPVPTPQAIARLNKNDMEMAEAQTPDAATRFFGTLASMGRDIPGVEAVQAFTRGRVRGQPYKQALADIRGAEADAPAYTRVPARMAGGLLAALAAPGSTALRQGAIMGGAEGLLRADDVSMGKRLGSAALGAGVGAAAGKVAEQVGTGVRALMAKPAGEAALLRRGVIADNDAALYGRADIEGLLTPSTPALQNELLTNNILPFAQRIRASETMIGASDADVAKETFKAMSEVQGKLLRQVDGTPEFLANARLQAKEIGLAKERLKKAMATAMPTYPKAVDTHAVGMQNLGSFKKGLDAARRAISSKDVSGRKIEMESPEAFVKSVDKMTKEEALAAIEGVIGAVKRAPKLTSNVLSGFGVFSSAARTPLALMRVQPFLHALDKKARTGAVARALEAASIASTLPTSGLLR